MKKPIIYNFPDRQAVVFVPGQVSCRTHHDGAYDFPLNVTDTRLANFGCRKCGVPIRWKQFKDGTVALSCHCFTVAHGAPTQPVLIDALHWADWIAAYELQEKTERLHSN
jgi:hypothetical protein